jgi:hypothetical protein
MIGTINTLPHKISREGDMLIYIVKTNDTRFYYLYEFLKLKYECIYSDKLPTTNNIKKVILPLEGIDEFGYIKHTNLKIDNLLKGNIEEIYTGKVNKYLLRICDVNKIKIISFYDDLNYCRNEFLVKIDVVKVFLEEKLNSRFTDFKTIILGNDYRSYLMSERLNTDIYDKGSISSKSVKDFLWNNYDVIINFSNNDLTLCGEKIIIEMNEIDNIDIFILLNCKKVYFINQLLSQYLTKSGGMILYDCMVNR